MLTPDQITAAAPDAASLKAGQGLATPRKWEMTGSDDEALWGLAMGSGKTPYQTRVSLNDLATKCSCPSRKFPCKHALGLMFMACSQPGGLSRGERPTWLVEWLDSRAAREEKAAAKAAETASKPVDEKAAEKRRQQRENRLEEGISLLRQAVLDMTREGLAAATARNPATWENLARRMVDSQAPGLAGQLRHLSQVVLRGRNVDEELPMELGRLHLLLRGLETIQQQDETMRAELQAQTGGRSSATDSTPKESVEDDWFVASRRVEEHDRLITSATWLYGISSGRWARMLRFAPVPQTVAEPWAVGVTVRTTLQFHAGLHPLRVDAIDDGVARFLPCPAAGESDFEALLIRYAAALAENPFLRSLPFLLQLRLTNPQGNALADSAGQALPWESSADLVMKLSCITGGHPVLACGEWDGRMIRLLTVMDGDEWHPLTAQRA